VRQEVKEGAEMIKMFVTGGHGTIGPRERTEMSRDEMSAAADAAHQRGARIRGHIANREAILMAVECGVDVIDHADGMDRECIERLAGAGTFVVPSQLFPYRFQRSLGSGLGFGDGMKADVEASLAILPEAERAGVKMVIGDDYGAIGFPHGPYADELEFYVKEAGIPTLAVIRWATKHGAELMGRGDDLGTVTEGKRADLLVVDGDPSSDITVLQDERNLLLIMKGGEGVVDRLDDVGTGAARR
jgi:imidazolonepropionase-like amidohydrolase